ncbi:hypothetical protein HK100_007174 [Physocladia obscura]|uniref:Cryptic loci regulator 2 N-terminal domain-containing protein n=1 Tax=Physocladia obscura TaxID=109957 RepID=A0AAD5T561_9FUNG|nr:hypothetical protein HK100_007174 [Physocladia obscura]
MKRDSLSISTATWAADENDDRREGGDSGGSGWSSKRVRQVNDEDTEEDNELDNRADDSKNSSLQNGIIADANPNPIHMLELNGRAAVIERQRVMANILHALASPEPQLDDIDDSDLKYDAFPKLMSDDESEKNRSNDNSSNDPPTDDLDGAIPKFAVPPSFSQSTNHETNHSSDAAKTPVFKLLAALGREPPPALPGVTHTMIPIFSDANSTFVPVSESENVVFCDLHSSDLEAVGVALSWLAKLRLDYGWPAGFRLISIQTTPIATPPRWDAYIIGHHTNKKFRSPNEFLPHLFWLCDGDPRQPCMCKICKGVLLSNFSHITFFDYLATGEENDDEHDDDDFPEFSIEIPIDFSDSTENDDSAHKALNVASEILYPASEVINPAFEAVNPNSEDNPVPKTNDVPEAINISPETIDTPNIINPAPDYIDPAICSGISPSAISPPPPNYSPAPQTREILPTHDEDWNGSDYNSESDEDYHSSNSGTNDSSDSDDESSMNDDDDDNSGNGSEDEGESSLLREDYDEDDTEQPLFPDFPVHTQKKLKAELKDLAILPPSTITELYQPCRKGEVVWYPSSSLNFYPPPTNTQQFIRSMPFWPCLVLETPESPCDTVNVIPLPLLSPSEVASAFEPTDPNSSELIARNTIRTHDTPSHYTPRPTHAPIFSSRSVKIANILPWRLLDTSPPPHSKKYPAADNNWQRRWNRGVIQALGISSSWEPIIPYPITSRPAGASAAEKWHEMQCVRWGIEVIFVGDWVHLVLPSPYVSGKLVNTALAGTKHRLMQVDRLVYRTPVRSLAGDGSANGEGEDDFLEDVGGGRYKIKKVIGGKVIVEGDVYAFRRGVGWFLVGKKRCTMKKVVIGRRFGRAPAIVLNANDKGKNRAILPEGSIATNLEIDEIGESLGSVGAVVEELRGVWDGWIGFSEAETYSSALLEMVKGLENQIDGDPNDGFDFNFSEDDDDSDNEEGNNQ